MKGYMYILECADGSYYVGSTNNLELRLQQHQNGLGANHTKKRLPVQLVYFEEYQTIQEAFYREKQVQKWRREKKEALIKGEYDKLPELARAYNGLPSTSSGSPTSSGSHLCSDSLLNSGSPKTVAEPVEATVTNKFNSFLYTLIKNSIGNTELLNLPKTAFLCSRKMPASVVLKCYDWAIAQREAGNCVISGFHSQIEKDVLHYLLKGQQPIIIALARGLKKKIEPELVKPLEEGRILIISPFDKAVKRVTERTAEIRNKMMIDLADNITVGYASKGGRLETLLKNTEKEIIKLV